MSETRAENGIPRCLRDIQSLPIETAPRRSDAGTIQSSRSTNVVATVAWIYPRPLPLQSNSAAQDIPVSHSLMTQPALLSRVPPVNGSQTMRPFCQAR
jgi:hypothetical protein